MKISVGTDFSLSRTIHISKIAVTLFFLLLISRQAVATTPADSVPPARKDSIQIGLITCSPGDEVYELFGHTAIRVQDPKRGIDIIFNYGQFSFNNPARFIYRFTKGETDYWLGVEEYQDFLFGYAMRNALVTEQVLNLSQEEARKLLETLIQNSLPENRIYRYNFLYDNCSTRARDMIVKQLSHKVSYKDNKNQTTFREWINRCTEGHLWLTFGINLVLGSGLDHPITYEQGMFLPDNLMQAFENAKIQSDTLVPLVKESRKLLEKDPEESPGKKQEPSPFAMPVVIAFLLLAFVSTLTVYECGKGKTIRWVDSVLFGLYGLTGCLIFFLMFISEHPATYPNYNAFWLHPFHLFVAIAIWIKILKTPLYWYHLANLIVLVGLMLSWSLIPQELTLAFLTLALVLAVRSVSFLAVHHTNQKFRLFQKKKKTE